MKIIAWYLPQFHRIKENDEWWGEGFTEWDNVRKATSLFRNHHQPRVPLDGNYYDLMDPSVQEWQSDTALQYGIYGFCYYHYWSKGQMLLEKPAEQMLNNKNIKIHFCFSWANHTWMRTWGSSSKEVLRLQEYGGEEEWRAHFDYLLPFFKDPRYITIDGKPLFVFYRPDDIPNFHEMIQKWTEWARENGLDGICFAAQNESEKFDSLFDHIIEYQPSRALKRITKTPRMVVKRFLNKYFDIPLPSMRLTFDYEKLWKEIIKEEPKDERRIPGAFVDWDDSPRRNKRGNLCVKVTPDLFRKYLYLQAKRAKEIYKTNYLFIFAWNEWGECGYLEPDELNKYGMLESVRSVMDQMEKEDRDV